MVPQPLLLPMSRLSGSLLPLFLPVSPFCMPTAFLLWGLCHSSPPLPTLPQWPPKGGGTCQPQMEEAAGMSSGGAESREAAKWLPEERG